MLLILPLLLFFIADAEKIEEINDKARKMLRKLNNELNPGLKWSDDLVKSANEELMGIKMVQVTAKVTARHVFNTSDPTPMEAKVKIAVARSLAHKQEKIKALRNRTRFGCNGVIRKNFTIEHDRMEIICLYRTGNNLEVINDRARMMLKNLSMWLNPRLIWNNHLVGLAYRELMHTAFVNATAKVKGKYDFKTSDRTPMAVKVITTVSTHFNKKENQIRGLAAGTLFGCNGIVIKNYKKTINRIEIACLYLTVRKDRREDTKQYRNYGPVIKKRTKKGGKEGESKKPMNEKLDHVMHPQTLIMNPFPKSAQQSRRRIRSTEWLELHLNTRRKHLVIFKVKGIA